MSPTTHVLNLHLFEIWAPAGIKNMFFGGDGIFLAALSGPGRVWLQMLPLPKLANALQPYLMDSGTGQTMEAGAVGGIVGSLLNGMR